MDIVGYEDLYTIDKEGNVWSKKYKRNLIPVILNGYIGVRLNKNGKQKGFRLHRLLGIHFIPNPLNLPCVDHKNGIVTDNRIVNLRWATSSQNNMNKKKQSNNTSGFTGVSFNKIENKFIAYIRLDGKLNFLGYFDTAEEASKIREAKATELFGEFKKGYEMPDCVDELKIATDCDVVKNNGNYVGVCFNKHIKKYLARITINKKRLYLGYFDTAEEASNVRQAKEMELTGKIKHPIGNFDRCSQFVMKL